MFFSMMGITYSDFQRVALWEYTKALMPLIYGSEWETNSVSIMNRHRITKITKGVGVVAPRRFGKTVVTSVQLLAMALGTPGIRAAVFSTGSRASQAIRVYILQMLKRLPENVQRRVVHDTADGLYIAQYPLAEGLTTRSDKARELTTDTTTSVIMFFPNAEKGLRGFTAHYAIIDEAAYSNPSLFKNVIAPCFGMEKFVVLFLSTPSDANNWYSELLEKKIFNVVNFGMACEMCTRSGRASQCTHSTIRLPKWKPKEGQRMLKELFKNDPVAYNREVLGVVSNASGVVFDKWSINEMFDDRERVEFADNAYDFIYTCMDMSGGGQKSDSAIVTIARNGHHYAVSAYALSMFMMYCSIMCPFMSSFAGLFVRIFTNIAFISFVMYNTNKSNLVWSHSRARIRSRYTSLPPVIAAMTNALL
jgi:hypothetical protein